MRRFSLFTKIFLMQIIVAISTILIIIPTIFLLVGDYFVSTQKEDILDDALRVASLSEKIADYNVGAESMGLYRLGIEAVGQNSKIVVINSEGKIIATSQNMENVELGEIDKKFIDPVKGGNSVVQLYGNGKFFGEQTLVAIAPILRTDKITGAESFIGGAVAMRTMPQIEYLKSRVIQVVIIAQLLAWLLAFVIAYFITRHITKPIRKMRTAAKSIASGNFNEKIEITSNDEIGQLAESFNSMTESLCELETMRSSFISDVSHELRTPMTIISGFVEGIVDGTIKKEEQRKYLDIVLNETKRLSRLVSELLESSRLEQGKIKINKTDIEMNRLVTESLIAYEQKLTEKNIDVAVKLQDGDCIAFADKDSIKRVLINLIDNAIKFTPVGGRITVGTENRNKKIYTWIENTGEGISKKDLKHIWERFYKTDKSRGIDKMGVGLGLHIVKTIISQHGGNIKAESVEGEFTRFFFSLDEGKKEHN